MPKASLQSFTREICPGPGILARRAQQSLMRILTLEAGEIIMTDSAFSGGKQSGALHEVTVTGTASSSPGVSSRSILAEWWLLAGMPAKSFRARSVTPMSNEDC